METSKIEPGLEEIPDTSDKSDKNEKSDIGEVGVEEENNVEGEEEEEEGFSFYDANAPKVTDGIIHSITDFDIKCSLLSHDDDPVPTMRARTSTVDDCILKSPKFNLNSSKFHLKSDFQICPRPLLCRPGPDSHGSKPPAF